jgi:acyl carrier protein
MASGVLTASTVREMLMARWPGRFELELVDQDAPLGEDGLGLDSIELVELVLACEELVAVDATEELIQEQPLTICHLVAHFTGK